MNQLCDAFNNFRDVRRSSTELKKKTSDEACHPHPAISQARADRDCGSGLPK